MTINYDGICHYSKTGIMVKPSQSDRQYNINVFGGKVMKKKFLCILLVCVLCVSLLAGCSGSGSSGSSDTDSEIAGLDGTWPEETIKIGVPVQDTTDDSVLRMMEYCEYLAQYYNLEFVFSESLSSSEDEFDFIDSCAASGCDAIFGYYNISGTEIVKECISCGMYYWCSDSELTEEYADEEYFLAGYSFIVDESMDSSVSGDYLGGYELGYNIAFQATHVIYCNGGASMGIQMFMDRQEGFIAGIAAAIEDGAEIEFDEDSDILEGWPGTDDYTAYQSKYLTDSTVDAVVSSFGTSTWLQPLADAGRDDIKLAAIESTLTLSYDAVNDGTITLIVYDCSEVVFGNAIPMIINAVTGNGYLNRDEDGNNTAIEVNRWVIDSVDTFNAIYEYEEAGNYFVTAEDLMQCFPEFNEDVTQESINEFYSSLTVEAAVEIATE